MIELMIVVAIIGILAAVAIPAYQNYTVKSKITEAIVTLASGKTVISESFASAGGTFPLTGASPLPALGTNAKYISALTYNGTAAGPVSIVATLQNTGSTAIDGKFLGYVGTGNSDGTISWTCATVASATATVAGAVTTMYPFLAATCQN